MTTQLQLINIIIIIIIIDYITRSFMICTSTINYFGVKTKNNGMRGACGTYGGEERFMQSFGGETWKEVTAWKDNIKVDFKEIGWESANWIRPAQDRDKRRSSCEHGNETSGCTKCGEILDWLWTCWILNKDSILCNYLANKVNLLHKIFLSVFISFLYMFRATMCHINTFVSPDDGHIVARNM